MNEEVFGFRRMIVIIAELISSDRYSINKNDMHKVLRGGSYYTFEKYCKVTSRYGVTPQRWDIDYGLRLVVSL